MTSSVRAAYGQSVYGQSVMAHPIAIEHGRTMAGEVLRLWGGSGDTVELVRLGVSELLGNVAKHVENPRCYLRMARIGAEVTVQVFDRSVRLPVLGQEAPEWDAESGRGLWMLREMADGFGCERTLRCVGKIVWFRCTL